MPFCFIDFISQALKYIKGSLNASFRAEFNHWYSRYVAEYTRKYLSDESLKYKPPLTFLIFRDTKIRQIDLGISYCVSVKAEIWAIFGKCSSVLPRRKDFHLRSMRAFPLIHGTIKRIKHISIAEKWPHATSLYLRARGEATWRPENGPPQKQLISRGGGKHHQCKATNPSLIRAYELNWWKPEFKRAFLLGVADNRKKRVSFPSGLYFLRTTLFRSSSV